MWTSFLDQRVMEMTPNESDEETDDEPEPKKSKSSSELKGKSVNSDDDSPVRAPSPAAKQQPSAHTATWGTPCTME